MHKLSKATLEKSTGKRIAHAATNTEANHESHIGTEGNTSCMESNEPVTELSEPNNTNTHKSVSRRNTISDVIIRNTESKNHKDDNDVIQVMIKLKKIRKIKMTATMIKLMWTTGRDS